MVEKKEGFVSEGGQKEIEDEMGSLGPATTDFVNHWYNYDSGTGAAEQKDHTLEEKKKLLELVADLMKCREELEKYAKYIMVGQAPDYLSQTTPERIAEEFVYGDIRVFRQDKDGGREAWAEEEFDILKENAKTSFSGLVDFINKRVKNASMSGAFIAVLTDEIAKIWPK